jgi:hypothetical protein
VAAELAHARIVTLLQFRGPMSEDGIAAALGNVRDDLRTCAGVERIDGMWRAVEQPVGAWTLGNVGRSQAAMRSALGR